LESAHIIQFLVALAKNSSFGFLALAIVSGKTKSAVCAAGFRYETQLVNMYKKTTKYLLLAGYM
jgi:hypothetical protein